MREAWHCSLLFGTRPVASSPPHCSKTKVLGSMYESGVEATSLNARRAERQTSFLRAVIVNSLVMEVGTGHRCLAGLLPFGPLILQHQIFLFSYDLSFFQPSSCGSWHSPKEESHNPLSRSPGPISKSDWRRANSRRSSLASFSVSRYSQHRLE